MQSNQFVDFNIGLAVHGREDSLLIEDIDRELKWLGFHPQARRDALSSSERTYVVRCTNEPERGPLAERVFRLAVILRQEAIAVVPHEGGPALCVGPGAHLWGGAFLPHHWISLA